VKALKILADTMESTIIAEGIERQEELETLLDLGIDYGQGYLLGKPGPLFGEQVSLIETDLQKTAPVADLAGLPRPAN
jgi:EAL domain-containing protein (putative c-di-GMP-specific phosphodiesterase class I)